MATSDFAQKLLHDLRLRKERMANTQNSDMYSNSRKNFKGSKETRTLEVGPKAGSRYRNSSNSQKTPARPQGSNQIVPYGGGHHSGQVNDLSMALAYAFDNRGKLKRLDIASSGPMMKILQQIGRKSTQQSFEIQWQSTNQFPNLTNLHINEISKGAQKLNQLLRACSTGGINISRDSIEIGKELWKGAMELEQSLRMLVSLQEASSDNMTNPQRKGRLRLLDDNENSEDDSVDSVEKQRKVECPVFSFDKPSKNTKASVQKLTIHTNIEDRNSKPESHMSITSISTPHRRTVSSGSELNTSQLTISSTSKHNAARLPNVIAKLMGLEEIPPISNLKVTTERSASQQRSRDSISTHTSPRNSKNAEVKIDYTRSATKPVNQIRMQSNKTTLSSQKIEPQKNKYESTKPHYTALHREKSNWRLEERQGTKNYVQESKTAISKINELQTKSMNLVQSSKTQNDIRKETRVKSMKQKQAAAEFTMHGNRSLNTAETIHAETLDNSNNHETREAETNKLQLPQKKHRNIDLQQTNMSHHPHGENLKAENRIQPKANHRNEYRKRASAENMQSSRIIARDMKILQKQLPARKEKASTKSAEDNILAGSKALLSNLQNKNRDRENVSKNSNDGRESSTNLKSQPEMTKVQATSSMETRSETKDKEDTKPPKIIPTRKMNQEITKAVIAPGEISRPLKPHESPSQIVKQNKRGKISASRAVTLANESLSKITESTKEMDEPSNQPICDETQQNEDVDQTNTSKEIVQNEHSHQQQKGIINTTPGDMVDKSISNIYDDHQETSTYEVRIKAPVTDGQDDCKVNSSHQQKQHMPMKVGKQEPLTEDEMFLKQKLILSHLFLNTAEALFKLNIPISILNYASDQFCEARDCKVILDCGYELLKRKGRRKVAIIYPCNNRSMSYTLIKSLDDLVRQLHRDFEALRLYGTNERDDYDYANSILKMLESDIYNILPDLNSMWDIGWNKEMFPCANMDEVICYTEQLILDELMNELINDYL